MAAVWRSCMEVNAVESVWASCCFAVVLSVFGCNGHPAGCEGPDCSQPDGGTHEGDCCIVDCTDLDGDGYGVGSTLPAGFLGGNLDRDLSLDPGPKPEPDSQERSGGLKPA